MDKTDMRARKSAKTDGDISGAMTRADDLATPTDLTPKNVMKVADALNALAADALVVYMKTKNFHWHVSGPHFRSYHVLLDEQAGQIFASIDVLTERARKLGANTLHSFSEVLKLTSFKESNAPVVAPAAMVLELLDDNREMAKSMRDAHKLCDDADDIATASLLEVFIDETEKRIWFLFETSRDAGPAGH